MIKPRSEMPRPTRIEIDLSGPDGNVFNLIALAKRLARRLEIEVPGADVMEAFGITETQDAGTLIQEQMMSGDYENALQVFDRYFGEWVILYR